MVTSGYAETFKDRVCGESNISMIPAEIDKDAAVYTPNQVNLRFYAHQTHNVVHIIVSLA